MTELQQALLDFIHAQIEARNEGPQTAEVQRGFRRRNEAGVVRALEGLAEAGHVGLKGGRWVLKEPQVQLHFSMSAEDTGPRPR